MMAPLDSTIVSVSLPTIAQDLSMDYAEIIWVPTAYLLALSVLILTMGRFSDIRGRKPVFVGGFLIFVLGSLLCSLSQTGTELIVFRIMQGIGAAFIGATATAIVTDVFPKEERGKALGVNVMAVYIGLSLGPPLGGILTHAFGWQSIFYINIPIGILVIALAMTIMRESKLETGRERFDVTGLVLFSVALSTLLVELTLGEQWGWIGWESVLLILISGLCWIGFILVERRMGQRALLDLRLFTHNRLFAYANLSALLNYASYFGVSFMISFYLQQVLDLTVLEAGTILLTMPVTMAVLSPFAGWLSDRLGSRSLASGGMFIIAFGLLWLSFIGLSSPVWFVVAGLVIIGLGMGMFSSPNTSAVMGSVERRQLGVASGTVATMRFVGQSMSLAIMGAIVASIAGMASLSGLFSGLPMDIGIDASAFVEGLRAAFLVSAGIAMIGGFTSLARGKQV
jgi:EmrB/QacA subfamily drug resistance transporter